MDFSTSRDWRVWFLGKLGGGYCRRDRSRRDCQIICRRPWRVIQQYHHLFCAASTRHSDIRRPEALSICSAPPLQASPCDKIMCYQEKQTDPPPRALSEKAGKI